MLIHVWFGAPRHISIGTDFMAIDEAMA